MKVKNYTDILEEEFGLNEESFLAKLRLQFIWDKEAFFRLTEAMKVCCIEMGKEETLPRWICIGFFYLSHVVRDIVETGHYRRKYSKKYYQKAFRRLEDLANWFFHGRSPYLNGVGFEPMERDEK